MTRYRIERQQHREINTDPQRRCYYGVHAKSEIIKLPWEPFESDWDKEQVQRRLDFWRDLNDYAVKARGKSANTDYRIVEMTQDEVDLFRGIRP